MSLIPASEKYTSPYLTTHFLEEKMPYTGVELRPHYLLTQRNLRGSAVMGFIGPCEVPTNSMVDWEDRMADDFIRAKEMMHFLGEFFGISLKEGVLLQRIFMSIAAQEIAQAFSEGHSKKVLRTGDDLFIDGKKLSVSIVTASPVSILLHVGINVDPAGAPVSAIGLGQLRLTQSEILLAKKMMNTFAHEVSAMEWACAKVRPVM